MRYRLEKGAAIFTPADGTIDTGSGVAVTLRHTEGLLLQCLLDGITEKRQIIDTVWHNLVVAEGSYHKLIFDLRNQFTAAGLDAALIKTIPRRGCVFNGLVEKIEDPAYPPADIPAPTTVAEPDPEPPAAPAIEVGDALVAPATALAQPQRSAPLSPAAPARRSGRLTLLAVIAFVAGGCIAAGESFFTPALQASTVRDGPRYLTLDGVAPRSIAMDPAVQVVYQKNLKEATVYYACKNAPAEELNCQNRIIFYSR